MTSKWGEMKSAFDRYCRDRRVRIWTTDRIAAVDDKQWHHYTMRCRVIYQGRALVTPFMQGLAHTDNPTAGDVLACLLSDAQAVHETFESWCSDLGLDSDSRKALATYEQCRATRTQLEYLLGKDYDSFEIAARDH